MSEQLLTPKIALAIIGLLIFLAWYLAGLSSSDDLALQEKSFANEQLPVAKKLQIPALAEV